jgi:hypothetical protein
MVERKDARQPLIERGGGITLSWNPTAVRPESPLHVCGPRPALAWRLLAETCALCGSPENVEVHHIRALRDPRRQGRAERPGWVQVMAARQRKTLVSCRQCHDAIHRGESPRRDAAQDTTLESRVLRKASARFGGGRMEKSQPRQLASRLPYLVVLCNGNKDQAEDMREELYQFLKSSLRLELSKEKTKITHLNDGFNFLGFRMQRSQGGLGMGNVLIWAPAARLEDSYRAN